MRKNFFILLILILPLISKGQKNYSLIVKLADSTEEISYLKKELSTVKFFYDTVRLNLHIAGLINELKNDGFLAAGIDSIKSDSTNFLAYLYPGKKYTWANIRQGNVQGEFLDGTGFRKKLFLNKPFRYGQVARIQERIIRNCENHGYPFAQVKLDSVEITDQKFSAAIALNINRLVRIDSIIIKGNANIVPVYIYNYLGIFPGDAYKESQVRKISTRFRELPFVREVKPSQVLFGEKVTKLYLFLENKKASQFDGVIGLLPDERNEGKFNLTGEVHLKLQNSLKRGEIIELNWKQLPVNSQDLKVRTLYPFIFNTPFGVEGKLSIFKKDSTYVDVVKNLGVQYALTGNNFIKAFVNDKQSDLQSTDGLENITILPEYADITTISYGATFHYEKLDYRLNPRTGFAVEMTGSIGRRKIRKNTDINPVVYERINLNSDTYQGELYADYFLPMGGRHVINLGTISAYIYNPDLFINELYRIGGLKSLRGFDEESIYASLYTIGKIEYRFLLEQNSFLFTFINSAWYENKGGNLDLTDKPLGFGAGINFETKIGIMSVSYALGKQFDNPVLFRNGKIHFGIVNYF